MAMDALFVGTDGRVTGTIVNYAGTAFEPTTLVYTVYDIDTNTIIGSANTALTPATDAPSGALSFTLPIAAQAMVNSARNSETHRIRFKWTYNAGASVGIQEVDYTVKKDLTPTS